jgi:hypothetical protein
MTQPARRNLIGIPLRPALVGRDAEISAYSLALWVEAFERLLDSVPLAEVRRLCGSSARDLALVLRSARRALGGPPAWRILNPGPNRAATRIRNGCCGR